MSEIIIDIEQRHKKEKKDLQSKIQGLKKAAGKTDKKKKKELLEQILRLEVELERRHLEELCIHSDSVSPNSDDNILNSTLNDDVNPKVAELPRISKAQKRRDKKVAEEKAREKMIIEQEVENINGPRNLEMQSIKKSLKERGLMLFLIPSNGDCLYGAISHQLSAISNINLNIKELRQLTADHIKSEKDSYFPFMSNPETGDSLSNDQFNDYCCKIAHTTTWGGQIELQALSSALKCRIVVLQATQPFIITQGDEFSTPPLVVTYHRFMYGLGEHYNSTQTLTEDIDEQQSCE